MQKPVFSPCKLVQKMGQNIRRIKVVNSTPKKGSFLSHFDPKMTLFLDHETRPLPMFLAKKEGVFFVLKTHILTRRVLETGVQKTAKNTIFSPIFSKIPIGSRSNIFVKNTKKC